MSITRAISRQYAYAVAISAAVLLAACGGDKKGPTDNPDPQPQATSLNIVAGDGQTAIPGGTVSELPTVQLLDQDGAPMSGVSVSFTVTGGGGSITGASAATGSSGTAHVGSWTLGPAAGQNTLRASVNGVPAVTFKAVAQATGAARKWTVMVYLAADNSLAAAGVGDLDEMEAAGVDPSVQTVVQAEFSKDQLIRAGCQTAACINRPNWNTFRYAITGGAAHRQGVDGTAIDIGDRDMTKASELREFVQWAKQTYPAEHYMLVLWNHGGGYAGLIEDVTTAGSKMMSIGDFQTALGGLGTMDVVDFDMCLMGGYETLVKLRGLASYAVFSEETVPGAGNPYTEVIKGIQQNPTGDGKAIAQMIADRFHASYAGNRASTTVSAYDLAGLDQFETALNSLAQVLKGNLANLAPTIADAAGHSQKYEYKFLTDIGNFLDTLRAHTADPTVRQRIDAVKTASTSTTFRLRNLARNGSATDAEPVDRSTGLNILLPSGAQDDRLPNSGPASFAAYQQLLPDRAWTALLADYLNAAPTVAYKDQGENRFEAYLAWDQNAIAQNVDVDFWILEPDGKIYIPALGSVTPNGRLTNDSQDDKVPFEGYLSNRNVAIGQYLFFARLYADPNDFEPQYNLAYRFGQQSQFQWHLQQNATLSKDTPIAGSPNATLQDVIDGKFTDLQFVASWTVQAGAGIRMSGAPSAAAGLRSDAVRAAAARVTPQQLTTVMRLLDARHKARASGPAGSIRRGAASPAPRLQGGK